MNKIIFFAILLFLVSACEKEDSVTDKITGTWNWTESYGDIAGDHRTPDNTGQEIRVIITKSSYQEIINQKSSQARSFEIQSSTSRKGDRVDMMFFENGDRKSIRFSSDTLKLFDECYDCYESSYVLLF